MIPTSTWCPFCSPKRKVGQHDRTLCSKCGGAGSERCGHCLCLECAGTGRVKCEGCCSGKQPCPECDGSGFSKGVLSQARCRACEGTGIVPHAECGGAGSFACTSCAALGHVPGCVHCESSGSTVCSVCFGSGMCPSGEFASAAVAGPIGRLLRQLPVTEVEQRGEVLDLATAVHRILTFLAFYHWSALGEAEDGEHELFVLGHRLHFRVALLSLRTRSSPAVQYHFLDVYRSGPGSFRVIHSHEKKAWR